MKKTTKKLMIALIEALIEANQQAKTRIETIKTANMKKKEENPETPAETSPRIASLAAKDDWAALEHHFRATSTASLNLQNFLKHIEDGKQPD